MMWRLFQRFVLRDLAKNRVRTGLTVLGIALGVAILLAIRLANHTAVWHFQDSINRVAGQTGLQIVPVNQPAFDETLITNIHWLWKEEVRFTPVLTQVGVVPDETGEVIQLLGVDMLADFVFRNYRWTDTGEPRDRFAMFQKGATIIGEGMARRYHLKPDDSFALLINDTEQTFHVIGVLAEEGLGGAYGGSLVLMDIAGAQVAFDMLGEISRIDLLVPQGEVNAIRARLNETLPTAVTAERPERRSEQVDKMLRAYRYNLTVLSFIALLVGLFLIYNTMSITVIRRRREIGTLRAIGMARRKIFVLFSLEALMLGVIGALLGVGLGLLLANGAVSAVSRTVETIYLGQPVRGLDVNPAEVLLAFVFGVVVSLLGAVAPVGEAAAVSPAEAARRASFESRVLQISPWLAVLGVVFWGIALLAAFQPPVGGLPVFGFVSALFIILGAALLMPGALSLVFGIMTPVLRVLFQEEGRLAALSLKGAMGRTAVAVASLMIGIAMMVSLAVMIGSFRQTVITWVNQSFRADLWIEPATRMSKRVTVRMQTDVAETIAALPGVEAVDRFYEFPVLYKGNPANLAVGEFDVFAHYANLNFLDGEPTEAVIRRAIRNEGVIITEGFALKNRVKKGDRITLETPTGPLEVPVEGVYYDYASDQGYVVIPRRLYVEYFRDDSITGLAVYLEDYMDTGVFRRQAYEALDPSVRLNIQTNRELKAEVLRIFDNTFAITYALHFIAIVVALLAVMNSLFAIVMESRREFGILKYIGASARQIRKMVLVEAALLGVLGNVAGLLVGFMLAFLLIFVINKQSFGWTIQLAIPAAFLVQSFALVLLTALLSGLVPARLAAKTPAPEVVRNE